MDKTSAPLLSGDIKTLIRISFPLMLFLFCEALTLFCERIFLSYYSLDAVHASLNGGYLTNIFQYPCISIGMMAQVFVGFYHGSHEYKQIGPCVWQLIWFSFLSFPLILPLSFLASFWYFTDTLIQQSGIEYFTIFAFANFLFPLNAALSSFYLGRGKTIFVTTLMLASYGFNLLLSWLLILGIKETIPPLGAKGAAIAKCLSLGLICCIFFGSFLTRKNRKLYYTGIWQFSPKALWNYMRPGMARAFGFFHLKICWVVVSYIILKKGGPYLDVLTIGATMIIFLNFITHGIYKAILTIASNLIGAGKHAEIWKLCRSFILYIMGISILLAIPLILFPDVFIYFFDSSLKEVFKQTFKNINHWIWLYFLALAIQSSFCALLVAWGDVKFQLYGYLFLWPISVIPVYFGIGLGGWHADKLWCIMAIENIAFIIFFFLCLRQKKWKESKKIVLS